MTVSVCCKSCQKIKMAASKPNQNSSDFEEYIRDLLECPVCMEIIKSVPVYQCANGHVICKDCIEKLNNCLICRNDSELRTLWFWHILVKGTHIYSNQKQPDFHQISPLSHLCPVCLGGRKWLKGTYLLYLHSPERRCVFLQKSRLFCHVSS